MIPERFKTYKLGDLIEKITKGTTPSTLGGRFVEHGVNFIKSEAIGYDGSIDQSTFVFIDAETHEKLKRSQLKIDDILFSMAGIFLGKNAIVTEDILPANTNQALAIIRLNKEKATPKFIHYFLRQTDLVKKINSISGQSAQPNINFEEIKSIEINLPEIQIQNEITSILSCLDNKIKLNRQMNKTLECIAQAIFKEWFVDKRFPGIDGELKNGLPEGWKRTTIESIIEELEVGSRPKGGVKEIISGIPSIGAESITKIGEFVFGKTKYVSENFYNNMRRGYIKDLDILIYKDGGKPGNYIPHISMFGYGFPFKKMCINEHVYRIKCRTNSFQMYLFFWLNTTNCLKEMTEKGTGVAIPGLNSTALKSISIVIPSEICLLAFEQIASSIVEKILTNSKNTAGLSLIRDLLLPKLMTGKIKVT